MNRWGCLRVICSSLVLIQSSSDVGLGGGANFVGLILWFGLSQNIGLAFVFDGLFFVFAEIMNVLCIVI